MDNLDKNPTWSSKRKAEVALQAGEKKMKELKNQLPVTQQKLEESQLYLNLKRAANAERQSFLARMMPKLQELMESQDKMEELRESQDPMQRASSEEAREWGQADQSTRNFKRNSQTWKDLSMRFELEVSEMLQQMLKDTQAELNQKLLEIQEYDYKKRIAEEDYQSILQSYEFAIQTRKIHAVAFAYCNLCCPLLREC